MPRIYWLTFAFTLLLSGCSNAPTITPATDINPLSAQDLSNILAAEIALHRGHNQQASELFLASANSINNAELAKRATYAAQLSNQVDTYKRSSQLWHHLQPEVSVRRIIQGNKESQETLCNARWQAGAKCYHGAECHKRHDPPTRLAKKSGCGKGTADYYRISKHRNSDAP